MAPVKYEEQMKDKLEKRSLQPSPDSWSALANRLDAEQKNKSKTLYWWFGIAASVVSILFVTTIYFNNQSGEIDSRTIVDTKKDVIKENEKQTENHIMELPSASNEMVVEEAEFEKQSIPESVSSSSIKKNATKTNGIIEKSPQQDVVVQSQQNEPKATLNSITNLTFEEQKIQDVVAQIKNMNSNGDKVTDTEIDSLLKKAQTEILSNRIYNEKTRMVDANALLQDVEEDLQQSFRSKVFEALQSGYETVITAVAERNN